MTAHVGVRRIICAPRGINGVRGVMRIKRIRIVKRGLGIVWGCVRWLGRWMIGGKRMRHGLSGMREAGVIMRSGATIIGSVASAGT